MTATTWMLAAAAAAVVATGGDAPPSGWVAVDPPRSEAALRCANYSQQEWSVRRAADGTPELVQVRHEHRYLTVRELFDDGALLGYNRGEFGGWIEWLPRDGGARFEQTQVDPVAATRYRGEAVIAEGLAHLDANRGSVLRFERRDGRSWRIHRLAELDAAPVAAVRRGDKEWVLLLVDGVASVQLDSGQVRRLHRSRDWLGSYVGSIQPLGDGWLIGGRRGAIRLEATADGGYRERWWTPARCAVLEPVCSCADSIP
ncbi:hypothetical protein RDV84_21990 [Lysobacter yananisis]|uniref:Uncharacterized protein n=1 Tax=Lysobacter yananisis TaxID=1003114 RepID=A0ABY9P6B2_9GAMM|nr:hypothetical protein [Lysobacter yananisis]WMT02603.1 hypothetical protein RDV84_21990 [Lysobacter yananisis]